MDKQKCLIYEDFFGPFIDRHSFSQVKINDRFELFLKYEGFNPASSIKLKTAISLISNLERNGKLSRETELIESSSGNLGVALAMICTNRGYKFSCVVDPNATEDNVRLMRALGTNIVLITEKDENGGYLHSRIRYIKEAVSRNSKLIWLNQYGSQSNPKAHEETTALEIYECFPNVNYVFVGAGTTGTLMGCAKFFKDRQHPAKIIAVDVNGSVTFGGPPGPRRIPGMGTSRTPEICDPSLVDDVIYVSESDSIAKCRWYARKFGLLLGGSTGSVLAGVEKYVTNIRDNSTVVTISPDCGKKYLSTIYDDKWVGEHFPEVLGK
jgi:N-(2-amino-2-carboxyethyl)-L-glutamate synthase